MIERNLVENFFFIVKLGIILIFIFGIDCFKENGYNIEVFYGRYFKYICIDDLLWDVGLVDISLR